MINKNDNHNRNKTTCKLKFLHGRPVFAVNGKPISYAAYSDPVTNCRIYSPSQWKARIADFVESGVHTYTIQPEYAVKDRFGETPFWTGDGIYPDINPNDYFCVDRQAEAVLEMDPKAHILVRFGDFVPEDWFRTNPEHTQISWKGKLEGEQPSLASRKALTDICRYLERVVTYCESRSWADRIIGYLYYPLGEGITNLNVQGFLFDQCNEMQKAFKAWVILNYKTNEALQEAWNNKEVTFETVKVPTDEEWTCDREGTFHWIEGNQLRKMRDYLLLQRELYIDWYKTVIGKMRKLLSHRPLLFGMDIAKQTMLGWQIRLFFDGMGPGPEFPDIISASGAIDVGELLDEPGLDFLVTPADYTARTMGYGWESEGIADSMRLRGKTIYVENDCRTFVKGEEHTLGAFKTLREVRAGMLRNAAWSLSRGHIDYWMISGAQYFHDPEIQRNGIRVVTPVLDRAPYLPHIETEHAIAMIIDDTGALYEDGTSGYQNLAVIWQRVIGLAHCGIPYRVYLFSDLQHKDMPDYKCYLFPNLFMLDEKKLDILKRKVFRDGRISIFGPATGITDGKKLSSEWASSILGVEMELVHKKAPRRVVVNGSTPITCKLPASMVYGDSQPYGPILVPVSGAVEAAGGLVLGESTTFWGINRPGLFVKDFEGKYKVAWSMAVPLPGNLLRELARFGNCHIWCEEDDVILASETIAAIHSIKSGSRSLRLPAPCTVWDLLTGEKIGDNKHEIIMNIQSPETRIFYMGNELPAILPDIQM